MINRSLVLLLLGLALSVAACTRNGPSRVGGTDIRGNVTHIERADPELSPPRFLGTILVEGREEVDTQFKSASIEINHRTRFFEQERGARKRVAFQDLRQGARVEVRFTGTVMESDPVQATGRVVVILPPDPDEPPPEIPPAETESEENEALRAAS